MSHGQTSLFKICLEKILEERLILLELWKTIIIPIILETIINDTYTVNKPTPNSIISDETIWKKEKGESKYIRNRKIPVKKTKRYPTKKKTDIAIERKNHRFDKYNMMNNFGN